MIIYIVILLRFNFIEFDYMILLTKPNLKSMLKLNWTRLS